MTHTHSHHQHDHRATATASVTEITGWVSGALPPDLYRGVPHIEVDRDEILVVGDIAAPEVPEGLEGEGITVAEHARVARFREETRVERMGVARQAEARYDRPISWGATAGRTTEHFTTVRAPVVTRLGLDHRKVLDRLVAAGIAEHRGQALAWCVDLVQRNEAAWLRRLEEALKSVEDTAEAAPGALEPSRKGAGQGP